MLSFSSLLTSIKPATRHTFEYPVALMKDPRRHFYTTLGLTYSRVSPYGVQKNLMNGISAGARFFHPALSTSPPWQNM